MLTSESLIKSWFRVIFIKLMNNFEIGGDLNSFNSLNKIRAYDEI